MGHVINTRNEHFNWSRAASISAARLFRCAAWVQIPLKRNCTLVGMRNIFGWFLVAMPFVGIGIFAFLVITRWL